MKPVVPTTQEEVKVFLSEEKNHCEKTGDTPRGAEILSDGTVWIVEEGESERVKNDPSSFPADVQRKYFGISEDQFKWFEDQTVEDKTQYEQVTKSQRNPFTGEVRQYVEYVPLAENNG